MDKFLEVIYNKFLLFNFGFGIGKILDLLSCCNYILLKIVIIINI